MRTNRQILYIGALQGHTGKPTINMTSSSRWYFLQIGRHVSTTRDLQDIAKALSKMDCCLLFFRAQFQGQRCKSKNEKLQSKFSAKNGIPTDTDPNMNFHLPFQPEDRAGTWTSFNQNASEAMRLSATCLLARSMKLLDSTTRWGLSEVNPPLKSARRVPPLNKSISEHNVNQKKENDLKCNQLMKKIITLTRKLFKYRNIAICV